MKLIPDIYIKDNGLVKFIELTELYSNFIFFGAIKINDNGWHYSKFEMNIQYVEPYASKDGLELYINGNILLSLNETFEIF